MEGAHRGTEVGTEGGFLLGAAQAPMGNASSDPEGMHGRGSSCATKCVRALASMAPPSRPGVTEASETHRGSRAYSPGLSRALCPTSLTSWDKPAGLFMGRTSFRCAVDPAPAGGCRRFRLLRWVGREEVSSVIPAKPFVCSPILPPSRARCPEKDRFVSRVRWAASLARPVFLVRFSGSG